RAMCVLVPRTRSSHISCCKSGCELRVQKGALENHRVASVPLIPKFASEVAARVCELRNPDTKLACCLPSTALRDTVHSLKERTSASARDALARGEETTCA